MAWIPIYADEDDFITITEKLNADSEIAYLLPDGKERWIAHAEVEYLQDGDYMLWHTPGGEILRFRKGKRDINTGVLGKLMKYPVDPPLIEAGWVEDPWKGWKGPHASDNETLPFLDSAPCIISLTVRRHGAYSDGSIGMSCFGWIGNRYRLIGKPASKETANWWRRLNRWISKESATKIPRSGDLDGPNPEIWAFPSAYGKINIGNPRDMNPI